MTEDNRRFVQTQIVLTKENNNYLKELKIRLDEKNVSNIINRIIEEYRKREEG